MLASRTSSAYLPFPVCKGLVMCSASGYHDRLLYKKCQKSKHGSPPLPLYRETCGRREEDEGAVRHVLRKGRTVDSHSSSRSMCLEFSRFSCQCSAHSCSWDLQTGFPFRMCSFPRPNLHAQLHWLPTVSKRFDGTSESSDVYVTILYSSRRSRWLKLVLLKDRIYNINSWEGPCNFRLTFKISSPSPPK